MIVRALDGIKSYVISWDMFGAQPTFRVKGEGQYQNNFYDEEKTSEDELRKLGRLFRTSFIITFSFLLVVTLFSGNRGHKVRYDQYGNQYLLDGNGRVIQPAYKTTDPYQQMGMYDQSNIRYYQ